MGRKGFLMRYISSLLIWCVFVSPVQSTKNTVKTSLALKYAQDSVVTLVNFPYPDKKEGKELAANVALVLNATERVFEESERLRLKNVSSSAMMAGDEIVRFKLENFALQLTLKKLEWALQDKVLEAKYTIAWDGEKWVVRDLPKEDKE